MTDRHSASPGGAPAAAELIARAWERRREGRLEDARRDLERAIHVSREDGPPRVLVRALGALAHVARDQGRDEEALELYEESTRLGRSQGDPLVLAHSVRHLGDVHRAALRLKEAERCYVEALELYERHPDPPPLDLANAMRPMAIVSEAQGRAAEAVDLWGRARAIYAELGITAGVEECEEHLTKLGDRGDP